VVVVAAVLAPHTDAGSVYGQDLRHAGLLGVRSGHAEHGGKQIETTQRPLNKDPVEREALPPCAFRLGPGGERQVRPGPGT